jgi:hypothetical protein
MNIRHCLKVAAVGGAIFAAGLANSESPPNTVNAKKSAPARPTQLRVAQAKDAKYSNPVQSPDVALGDSWTYAERDGHDGAIKTTWSSDVVAVDDKQVEILSLDVTSDTSRGDYTTWYSRRWNLLGESRPSGGRTLSFEPALVYLPFPLEPGKSWHQELAVKDSVNGKSTAWKVDGKVAGWERVKVPAGEFDAIKIVRQIDISDADSPGFETRRSEVDWYAPAAKSIVRHEESEQYYQSSQNRLTPGNRIVRELVTYTVRDWTAPDFQSGR